MVNEFTLPIDKRVILMLIDSRVSLDQYLDENKDVYEGHILSILSNQHSGDGGAPTVMDYRLDLEDETPYFNTMELTGSFGILYGVDYYYGCDDQNNYQDFQMTVDISIDIESSTITFECPEEWIIDN